MQDANTANGQYSLQNNGNLPLASREQGGALGLESAKDYPPTEPLKGEQPLLEPPVLPHPDGQRQVVLPQRGLSYATIAGAISGVLAAVLTIVITLVNTGTFQTARQQIVADRLTVKTALALAGWELLTFVLSVLIGFLVGMIIGKIAVRRRLGFLAGMLAGAVFYLIMFLVALIPNYPGNLAGNGTAMTAGSLVISLLFLCLWSIGGGLVSLFGTWIMTVKHPHYIN